MDNPAQQTSKKSQHGVPISAKWLGGAGALPFIVLSSLSFYVETPLVERTIFALIIYGAVILSFLGGIHWGLAISTPGLSRNKTKLFLFLLISVFPPLIGWLAVLLTVPAGLMVLGIAFLAMLLYDWIALRKGLTPKWYLKLRGPLTVFASGSSMLMAVIQFYQS